MKKIHLIRCFAGFVSGATLLAAHAQEASYPTRSIRLVVPSSPGGLADTTARLYAERMSKSLQQPIVIENLPGASTMIGTRKVAQAAPDGYTLLIAANTLLTMPYVVKNAGYSPKDFIGIGEVARAPNVLVVPATSPFKSIPDLVAAAKKSPGSIAFGSGGIGTTSHLPVELFAKEAGLSFRHIPYKGIALAVTDIVTGRISFMMGTSTSKEALIKSGKLRALAVTSVSRSPIYPTVPTFKELGYPEASYDLFVGMLAPAGLPSTIRKRLGDALEEAKKDPKVIERLKALGQEISTIRTPEQFEAYLRQEEEKSKKLIKETNIVADEAGG